MKQPQISYSPCILVLAVLLAGMAAAPRPAGAQDLAPTAVQPKPEAGLSNSTLRPGQVKKEEEEEDNVYRHTALVQSISDAVYHDDKSSTDAEKIELRERHIETTARVFEWINFAIILLAIVIPIARILPRVIRKRAQTLSHNLEVARKTTADANARLNAVEAQLARLDDEIARIRTQVEEESKQDEVRIKATIEEERARIVTAAEQEINMAAVQAQRGLRHFAADLAIEQATRQLVLTPENDRALIAEFVADVTANGTHTPKGGQN